MGQPLEIFDTTIRDGFRQCKISLQWTPHEATKGYLLIPNQKGKKPAVITLYYEPETAIGESDKPDRDFAYQLARRGFVTLSLGTAQATEAKTYALYYPSLDSATVEPLSMLAYAAANAWHALSLHPEVDPTKIGVMGHSFGGKWAMFASCLFDKFACSVWSDPGICFRMTDPASIIGNPGI
jgi:dienelactone hydrolase